MAHTFGNPIEALPLCLNIPDETQEKPIRTILLIGIDRGGTSATAAVVDALGVPIGETNDGHFETFEFKGDFNTPAGLQTMTDKISQLNDKHEKWGTQVWNNIASVPAIAGAVRNPYLLIVFRDIIALTQAHLAVGREMSEHAVIYDNLASTQRLIAHTALGLPTMLVSFERLRIRTEDTVRQIAAFLDVEPSSAVIDEAISRVSPVGGYLI